MNDVTMVQNHRNGQIEQVYTDGILDLANAIIERAVMDYTDEHASYYERNQIERFFRSEYFTMLSRGCVSPESIIKHLREVI